MDPVSYNIALNLSYEDLSNLAAVNKMFNRIYVNNYFWYAKYVKDYGKPDYVLVRNWKSYYQQRYKEEKVNYYMYINTLEPELS